MQIVFVILPPPMPGDHALMRSWPHGSGLAYVMMCFRRGLSLVNPLKDLRSIADALERLVALAEAALSQQGLRLPPRPTSSDEPLPAAGALHEYDPLREAMREERANALLLAGDVASWEDGYEQALAEERQL